MDYEKFFMEEVPAMLKKLDEDQKPQWGNMNASQMLNHLRVGLEMSLENLNGEITTPEEKLPSYKKFLMSDRPFGQNLSAPDFFVERQKETPAGDLEDLKVELLKGLVEMQAYFEKHPDHQAVHPSFGWLNSEEWKHLHKKHILHHFSQFGLT